MSLALIAALPFLGALLPGVTIRAGRAGPAVGSAAVTGLALVLVLLQAGTVLGGDVVQTRLDWMPSLGLNLTFMLDGLGLLFALMILGIGLLVILYAHHYLTENDPAAPFYTYLMLFQGAMLGLVLSDNILILLIFWELTSLSSFLLIGYWSHLAEARRGALLALTVTGIGGLALIAGMLILGHVAGSYDLGVILRQKAVVQASPLYLPALILILIGAFTKSAQLPFHFWLPRAMAAPTPVSAYLHSATMVKAGLFLMARLSPVLAGSDAWFLIVATTGLVTMAFAAKVALFEDDLKAILAYSTISHLGLITFLLGLGTPAGTIAAMFHILCHAAFKAALFMVAGIVDHSVHSRDIRRLGGLRRLMPLTFAIALISTLSMAGVPPLSGFLSKEMMLDAAAETHWLGNGWLVSLLALAGASLSVAYAIRFIAAGFLGPVRPDYPHQPHDPVAGLWLSPALLAGLVVALGLWPMTLSGGLIDAAASAASGQDLHAHLALWHGPNASALWMSFFAFGAGFGIYAGYGRLRRIWDGTGLPSAARLFQAAVAALGDVSQWLTDLLHDGNLSRGIFAALSAIVGLALFAFAGGGFVPGQRPMTPVEIYPAVLWLVLLAAILAIVVVHRRRFLTILLLGVVGLLISVAYAYLAAPDLALTQITVEVVTVVLLLLALSFLPKTSFGPIGRLRLGRDAGLAGMAGLAAGCLTYAMLRRDAAFPAISKFHLANSKPGAGGENAVNTIIVDFRGYDTFGEIIVLGTAALLIAALGANLLAARTVWAARPSQTAGDSGDPHPEMFRVAARFLLPFAFVIGIHMYLRGHNLPGGGFVAGLVFAIGYVVQYIAAGLTWTKAQLRINYQRLIGLGMLASLATGAGSFLAGRPFLTSTYGYFRIPPMGKFELATAMAFDLGVLLCVFGAVMLTLDALAGLARKAGRWN